MLFVRALMGLMLISLAVMFSGTPFAHSWMDLASGHPMVQLGGYVSLQGKQQHLQKIEMEDMVGDEFILTNNHDSNFLVGVGYFIDGKPFRTMKMLYGINALYLANTAVFGTVIQENLFANLSYTYKITHYPVYAIAKSTFDMKSPKYALTAEVGVGPNFMHTNEYHNASLDGGLTNPDDAFRGRTSMTFSATAGVGIKFNHVFGPTPLECGYRFFYLGHGGLLNKATDQIITTLETGTAYANALICSVTV